MNRFSEYAKKHWHLIAGSVIGLLVLYLLVEHLSSSAGSSSSTSSSSTPVDGSGAQVQALNTAADLQTAQVNGQITVAAYQAQTADNATAAAAKVQLATVAAQLAATQSGQQEQLDETISNNQSAVAINKQNVTGAVTINKDNANAAVELQQITSGAAVAQTAIEGETLDTINKQNTDAQVAIQTQQLNLVKQQIGTLMQYSKHFGTDVQALAPTITAELGEQNASIAASNTNAQKDVAASQTESTAINAGASVLKAGIAAAI